MLNSGHPVDIRPVCTPGLLIGFSDTSMRYFNGWPYLKYPCHFPRAGKNQHLALPSTLLEVSFKDRVLLLTVADILSQVAPYTKSYSRLLCMEHSWKGQHHLKQVRFLGATETAECHHAVSPINTDDKALNPLLSNRNPVSCLPPRLFSQMVLCIHL